MIAVVQRVESACVVVDGKEVSRIGKGMLVLVGVGKGDRLADAELLARKIGGMRIFSDPEGKMNLALGDPGVEGKILAVSQFTLLGDLRKGRRPAFDQAAEPGAALPLFDHFVLSLRERNLSVSTGVFGAAMKVALVNEGPVTFVLDTAHLARR